MINREVEVYTDVMRQAFETFSEQELPEIIEGTPLDNVVEAAQLRALFGSIACQEQYTKVLREIDWSDRAVNIGTYSYMDALGEQRELTADEQINRLAVYAFDDARLTIKHAIGSLPEDIITDNKKLRGVLLASKANLLCVARMTDSSKGELFGFLDYDFEVRNMVDKDLAKDMGDGMPLTFDGTRLRWRQPLQTWIEAHYTPDSGCPAGKVILEVDGHKQTLLHAFWEEVVERSFPDNQSS